MRMLIKNGRIIDPVTTVDTAADILIENGRIEQLAPDIQASGDTEIIDARG